MPSLLAPVWSARYDVLHARAHLCCHTKRLFVVKYAYRIRQALARALALQGRKVLLLERSLSEPNRIVGELLQPGGVEKLHELGMLGALSALLRCVCFSFVDQGWQNV